MKLSQFIAVASGLLAVGCASLPREADRQLAQTFHRYQAVKPGMTRAEVVAALGAPQSVDATLRRVRWEKRFDKNSFDALAVTFDPSEKVVTTELTERRERNFLGRAYASTAISRSGFVSMRDTRTTTESGAVSGGIYHDYDYNRDGSISPYVPPRFP
jgi:hypothetical protein